MSYELRLGGETVARFEEPEQALARARELLRADPDRQVEIFDSATGWPFEPAASRNWQEDLARKIGY